MMNLLKGRALMYVLGVLVAIIVALYGTVFIQGKIADYKDFQIQQLELDVKEAKLDGLINAYETGDKIHTEATNEEINTTLNDKRIFTGSARL